MEHRHRLNHGGLHLSSKLACCNGYPCPDAPGHPSLSPAFDPNFPLETNNPCGLDSMNPNLPSPVLPVTGAPRPLRFPGQDILNSTIAENSQVSVELTQNILTSIHQLATSSTPLNQDQVKSFLSIFFKNFYNLFPIMLEVEFYHFLNLGQIPMLLIHAICSISSLYLAALCKSLSALPALVNDASGAGGDFTKGPVSFQDEIDLIAEKSLDLISPRVTKAKSSVEVWDVFALQILATFYYFRNNMALCYTCVSLEVQVMSQILTLHQEVHRTFNSPRDRSALHGIPRHGTSDCVLEPILEKDEEIISRLFWTGYVLDRFGAFLNGPGARAPILQIETFDYVPRQPIFNLNHSLILDTRMLYDAYVRTITLLCRAEMWMRFEMKKQQMSTNLGCMENIISLGSGSKDTLEGLHGELISFPLQFKQFQFIHSVDQVSQIEDMAYRISEFEMYLWLMGNWMFLNTCMHTETCPRERWRIIKTIAHCVPIYPTPPVSCLLRLACEFAFVLIQHGHILENGSNSDPCRCPPATRTTSIYPSTGGSEWESYPSKVDVIQWFEKAKNLAQRDFWSVSEDWMTIDRVLTQLKQDVQGMKYQGLHAGHVSVPAVYHFTTYNTQRPNVEFKAMGSTEGACARECTPMYAACECCSNLHLEVESTRYHTIETCHCGPSSANHWRERSKNQVPAADPSTSRSPTCCPTDFRWSFNLPENVERFYDPGHVSPMRAIENYRVPMHEVADDRGRAYASPYYFNGSSSHEGINSFPRARDENDNPCASSRLNYDSADHTCNSSTNPFPHYQVPCDRPN
jgi:hypothetical protein